jgi:hypothetical protein
MKAVNLHALGAILVAIAVFGLYFGRTWGWWMLALGVVCTPEDAFRCFMGTEIEILAIGNCWLAKDRQDPNKRLDYKNRFELD